MARRKSQNNPRIAATVVIFTAMFAVLALRLVELQIIEHETYVKKGEVQHFQKQDLMPRRGKVFDRHQAPLAINVPAVTVIVNKNQVKDRYRLAVQSAQVLDVDAETILKKLDQSGDFVEIARKCSIQDWNRLKALDLSGIDIRKEYKRQYPKGKTASQIIGFTDIDGIGRYGIEGAQNSVLQGKPGLEILVKTATSSAFPHPRYHRRTAVNGDDVVLTIDYRYQRILEEEIERTVNQYNAESGTAVLMHPETGEIFAMCSAPLYDANYYRHYSMDAWRLRAITDQFEPGSTFKVPVMAAMLDAGYRKPSDTVFAENGTFKVMGEEIQDTKPHGTLTMREVIVHSSNIGNAKTVREFDKETLYTYLHNFGFGRKSGIQLLGEIAGILKKPNKWYPFTKLAMSYGHGVAVTPLQMACMFSTIANDGVYVPPRIIKGYRRQSQFYPFDDERNNQRVISVETARLMRTFMADVVARGTGVNAKMPELRLCGKTGTAHMVRPGGYGYYKHRYIASFGGFFPARDPQMCLFIMIRDPRNVYYGGTVAAPCFKRIVKRLVNLEGVDYFQKSDSIDQRQVHNDSLIVPNFAGLKRKDAVRLGHALGFRVLCQGEGNVILDQHPAAGGQTEKKERIVLFTDTDSEMNTTVPRVVGMSVRRAMNIIADNNLKYEIHGFGRVVQQTPQPGEKTAPGKKVALQCSNTVTTRNLFN